MQLHPVAPARTRPRRAGLLVLLLLGGWACLWGLAFGLPHIYTPDEPAVVGRALVMARTGDLNPHFFTYPHLVYNLQAGALWLTTRAARAWPQLMAAYPALRADGVSYLVARGLSVALALLALSCAYGMGRDLTGAPATGLIATLYLATMPVVVQHAHYATVDLPSAAAAALCGYACLRALVPRQGQQQGQPPPSSQPGRTCTPAGAAADHSGTALSKGGGWLGGRRGALALGALAAGLAAGTKYNAALVLICPLLTIAVLWARAGARPGVWRVAAAGLAVAGLAAAAYLVTTPYTLLDWPGFRAGVLGVARHYGAIGHPGAEGADNWRWYLAHLGGPGVGLPLTALALAGGAWGLARRQSAYLVTCAFVAAYYLLLCAGQVRFERNLLPLLPFLAALAAAATTALCRLVAHRVGSAAGRAALLALLLLTAGPPAAATARQDIALTRPFTQDLALAWLVGHLPVGAGVAVENWEAPPLPPGRYRLARVSALGQHDIAWYRRRGVAYLVADSWTDGPYLGDPGHYAAEATGYRRLFGCSAVIGTIHSASQDDHRGPDYTFYRLRPTEPCGARPVARLHGSHSPTPMRPPTRPTCYETGRLSIWARCRRPL